jgi:hypothetical protein
MAKKQKVQCHYIGRRVDHKQSITKNNMSQHSNNSLTSEYNQDFKNGKFINRS